MTLILAATCFGLDSTPDTLEAKDRTPGRKAETAVPGAKSVCRTEGRRTTYEIALPLRLLKNLKAGEGSRLILDLSFPLPADDSETKEAARTEGQYVCLPHTLRQRFAGSRLFR